jgi:hypothetical protein
MMVSPMFVGVLAVEFAVTPVESMDPMAMFAMTGDPDVFIPTIPISRDTFVKSAIADIDVKTDGVRGWSHH